MAEPLAVIIVTHNSRREIGLCLASLSADLEGRPTEVIVVDNASMDGTAKYAREHSDGVTVLEQGANRGFAAANNVGLKATTCEKVLLLNPDTVVRRGAIDVLMEALDRHPDAGVVAPKLLNPDNSLQPSCREFPTLFGDLIGVTEAYRLGFVRRWLGSSRPSLGNHSRERRVDWLSGACLLVRREAIRAVGEMDEGFFMYSEEMEWQYRMARGGWSAWFEPEAQVVHMGGASTAAHSRERIIWQYQSIWRFYRLYRSGLQRGLLRIIIWSATWPKILLLLPLSLRNAHRRELLAAFWRVLWLG